MNLLALDFETYFSDDFTLKKLTTEHYVRDPRFEVLGVGLRWPDFFGPDKPKLSWVPQQDVAPVLEAINWANTAVLCHHAHFDCLILSHVYGIKPRFIYDTLSMARLQLGNHLSVSLASLAAHYGLEGKSVPYNAFIGRRWRDIDDRLRSELGAGCLHDIELTWDIFQRLAVGFPQEEYQVIDMTVKMFTEPQLEGDVDVFARVWNYERERKTNLLAKLAVDPGSLQSADAFAGLLRSEGVEPETKPGKNNPIYAFAKTDDFMQGLLEDPDERIRTLAEARLGIKSTLDQTRAERLGFMATRGPMPLYHSYCAAHTTRWGGGDKINIQNLKRGSDLRKGLKAPRSYTVVKADKSQIECRILEMFASEEEGIEEFRQGKDPYTKIASKFYGFEVTREHKLERQFGKVIRLQCGFQAGGESIMRAAKRATIPVIITLEQGFEARDLYRNEKPMVKALWSTAGRMISAIGGCNGQIEWGPLAVSTGRVSLQGIPIWYPELHFHRDEESGEEYWRYKSRKGWVKLYGGKLVENVVQFMSRVDMSQSLLRILKRTNIRPAQLEHDAAVWVVPNDLVEAFKAVVEQEMTRAPTWLPEIPLACDITTGETM